MRNLNAHIGIAQSIGIDCPDWLSPYSWTESEPSVTKGDPQILVVDDDPVFCQILMRAAKKKHCQVTACRNLKELIALPKNATFNVAILDYYFGDLTGEQVAYLLDREVPIFYVSAQNLNTGALTDNVKVRGFANKAQGVENILAQAISDTSITPIAPDINPEHFPEYEFWESLGRDIQNKIRKHLTKWFGLMAIIVALSLIAIVESRRTIPSISPSHRFHLPMKTIDQEYPLKWDKAPIPGEPSFS